MDWGRERGRSENDRKIEKSVPAFSTFSVLFPPINLPSLNLRLSLSLSLFVISLHFLLSSQILFDMFQNLVALAELSSKEADIDARSPLKTPSSPAPVSVSPLSLPLFLFVFLS